MTVWQIESLLGFSGWQNQVTVATDEQGIIQSIEPQKDCHKPDQRISGAVIPGQINGHSHAFQFAMAGCAEGPAGGGHGDFWKWRQAMYSLAEQVSPDHLQSIAELLYSEMLRRGITHVVEFHYLHHQVNGSPYENPAETSLRLIAAAATTGIGITLIPIFYQTSNFGKPALPEQMRFTCKSIEQYFELISAVESSAPAKSGAITGAGVHSLRAASASDIQTIFSQFNDRPLHLHVAEQQQEIVDCQNFYRKRPVEWCLENLDISENCSLVHATHLTASEIKSLAKSDATVVICPSTEANLGDGFFSFAAYVQAGGYFSIGTDSHIRVDFFEDLRWLNYGMRLQTQRRLLETPFDDPHAYLKAAWQGGLRSSGRKAKDYFAVGQPFDAVELDLSHPMFIGKKQDHWCAALVYGSDASAISRTISKGSVVVEDGKHHDCARIKSRYLATMAALRH